MSTIADFDYDSETHDDIDENDAWYQAVAEELQVPQTVVLYGGGPGASHFDDEKALRAAAVIEAVVSMTLRTKHNTVSDHETAILMVFPTHTAIQFEQDGKRVTIRVEPGQAMTIRPDTLFSLDVN